MTNVSVTGWAFRFVVLLLLFIIFYAAGVLAVFGLIPDLQPEPGLVPAEIAIMRVAGCLWFFFRLSCLFS